jgi:hypothetical protein
MHTIRASKVEANDRYHLESCQKGSHFPHEPSVENLKLKLIIVSRHRGSCRGSLTRWLILTSISYRSSEYPLLVFGNVVWEAISQELFPLSDFSVLNRFVILHIPPEVHRCGPCSAKRLGKFCPPLSSTVQRCPL